MTLAAAALAALLNTGPEVRAVRLTSLDSRTALRVLTSEDVPETSFLRDGRQIVIRFPAPAVEGFVLPSAQEPIAALHLELEETASVLRIDVGPEIPVESMYEPGMMTLVFGERGAQEPHGRVPTAELYARLFPIGAAGTPTDEEASQRRDLEAGGWAVGRATLRPYAGASWTDADIQAFESPEPVRARYLEVTPGLTASAPFLSGLLAAEYEPRLRLFSNIPEVTRSSHLAGLRLELPVGSRTLTRLAYRFTRATLEASVVDPGREYSYDLSRFTFHDASLTAHVEVGPRLFTEAGAGIRRTRFDDSRGGFFDYDSRAIRAGIGYDLGESSLVVAYTLQLVPPSSERSIVETTAHAVTATLSGEIGPFMTGRLSAGYRAQTSPVATGASGSYRGLVVSGALRRSLGRSSGFDLSLRRSVELSAFETNAYYVGNAATLSLNLPLRFAISGRGSATWLRNDYPNDASQLGTPRRDEMLGFTIGLSRSVGTRASISADYRRERRDSNVPGLDTTTDGWVLQLTIGHSAPGGSRP